MASDMRRLSMWIACAFAIIVASGCTRVIETTPLHQGALGFGPTCVSPFGAYYLPKRLLKVGAKIDENTKKIKIDDLTSVPSADRTQPLCLDYLGSLTSADVVAVKRSPNGLLESVNSLVIDKTPEIFAKLAETGANFAIAAARAGLLESDDTIDVEFDPFNWIEMMAAKSGLRRFGVCVYVEGYTFPTAGL